MIEFDVALNIRDLSGNLVLALEDEANGYWVRAGGMPAEERRWNRRESRSPWVDGASDDGATLDRTEVSVLVKVFGPSWAVVEGRLQALLDATTAHAWLLEQSIEGASKTWRAGPADVIVPPTTPVDIANKRRFVVLSFPVQPSPAVTGV